MTEQYGPFLKRIASLQSGDRATLRRAAGVMLRNADSKAVSVFYRVLPKEVPKHQEDRWFAVACLRCLWDKKMEGGEPLERLIARMIESGDLSASTPHRFELLLDTDWDHDGYMLSKLTRLIKMIHQKSDRSPIEFAALLNDLIFWNAENQTVKMKWARTIFGAYQSRTPVETSDNENKID